MAGAGYNIPISFSAAQTFSVPQTQTTPTYFVFRSAGAKVGGDIDAAAESYAPATATSSAAQRDATAVTGEQSASGFFQSDTQKTILIVAAIAAVALLGAIWIYKRQ